MSLRRLLIAFAIACLWIGPRTAAAQVNPFEEDDQAEKGEKPKKADDKDAKDEKGKKDEKDEKDDKKEKGEKKKGEEAASGERPATDASGENLSSQESVIDQPETGAPSDDEKADVDDVVRGKPSRARAGERVPLTANYSPVGLIVTGVVAGTGSTLVLAGTNILGEPRASFGPPSRGSLDYGVSIHAHGDLAEGGSFLLGIPTIAGWALPAVAGGYYLVSALYYGISDAPMIGAQSNAIDHKAIGYAQTLGWTALAVGAARLAFGRERPYVALARPAFAQDNLADTTSFLSARSALSFAFASYVSRDVGNYLVNRAGWNFLPGRLIPAVVAYGVATLASVAHVRDQQNFLSDEVVGAVLGGVIGNCVYAIHFDDQGNPRLRNRDAEPTAFAPFVAPGPSGEVSAGLVARQRF